MIFIWVINTKMADKTMWFNGRRVDIMWRISYLNLNNDKVEQKGGFNSDKEAIEKVLLLEEDYMRTIGIIVDEEE